MYVMNRHLSKHAVSQIIAALLLIAIAVAAAILLYVFSIGLLGSLGSSGGSQTKQQLVMEAYSWTDITAPLTLHLRNVGSAAVDIADADFFISGQTATIGTPTCTPASPSALPPQGSCSVDVTPDASVTINGGVAYVVKVVTPDGAVFSYTAIAGQAS